MKQVLRSLVHSSIAGRLMQPLERHGEANGYYCRVLTYHLIEDVNGFAEQMDYVAHHYDVISMSELLHATRTGRKLPPRAMLITFDDAYINFAECAWPILRDYQLPVTLFVPTGYPDQPERAFWWDRLRYAFMNTQRRDVLDTPIGPLSLHTKAQRQQGLKRMKAHVWTLLPNEVHDVTERIVSDLGVTPPPSRILSWNALRRLSAEGVTLGAHTKTHPNLAQLPASSIRAEVGGSLQELQEQVGDVLPIFAYPAGYFNDETIAAVAKSGIELAFTTRRGTNDIRRHDTQLQMRRNNVGSKATLPILRARLLQTAPTLNRLQQLIKVFGT